MKIGILTFHYADNYGSILQAYALQKFLREQGNDVETIDYRPPNSLLYYGKGLVPIGNKLNLKKAPIGNLMRVIKMRKFLLKNIRLTPEKIFRKSNLSRIGSSYDAVIVGSDQVWCIDSFRGFDASFFLDFVPAKEAKKISYAASFGHTSGLNGHKREISNLLDQFDSILVRDNNSIDVVNKVCERKAQKVLDPTFLVNYESVEKPIGSLPDYLLIYNQRLLNKDEEATVRKIADSRNLKIFSAGKHNRISDKNFVGVGPDQWLNLYKNASYVITNTYHGTIFSLIFRKPFYVFSPKKKSNKILDLLDSLDLSNRIYSNERNGQNQEFQVTDINYEEVGKKLDILIHQSKSLLLNGLKN